MADPRFFRVAGPFTVGEISALTGAEIGGAGQADLVLDDVSPLEAAGPAQLSFLSNKLYVDAFSASKAGAAFVHPKQAECAPPGMTTLVSADPYKAFARASQAFYPVENAAVGLSPGAYVDPSAHLGEGISVGPNAVIGAGVEIGARTQIGACTVIGTNVKIGADCRIGANVTLSHCLIGQSVTLFPGVRVGQDGFGFAPDVAGHVKVPQLGRVVIGDFVEIGANSTIDRGAGPDTIIGAGTMIDNLVQIGHNVSLGRGCVLVAQSGVAGSAKLGDFVMVGGQAAIVGHLSIGTGARVSGKSGVTRDVLPGSTVGGIPAVPFKQWLRQAAVLARLANGKEN